MRSLYENNEAFRNYVDRYAVKHEVSTDVALTHSTVRNAYEYYLDAEKKKATTITVNAGCGGASAEMGECK